MALNVKNALQRPLVSILGVSASGKIGKASVVDVSANEGDVFRATASGTSYGSPVATATQGLDTTNDENVLVPSSIAGLLGKGANLASAATITFLNDGNFAHITGTTTITDIDYSIGGRPFWVCFDGALTLTHNATSLILPTGASITTAAGDTALFVLESGDNVRCLAYLRKDGSPLVGGSFTTASTTEVLTGTDTAKGVTADSLAATWEKGSDVASAATVSLGEGGYFHITGTTTITDIDFATTKAGRAAWVVFDGVLTLTHNGTTLILPTGANITTAAGDTCLVVSEGGDNVRVVAYYRASGAALVLTSQAFQTITPSSGNMTLDGSVGRKFKATATTAVVFHTFSNLTEGQEYVVKVTASGGARAVTVDAASSATVNFGAGVSIPSGKTGWFTVISDATTTFVAFSGYGD